MLLADLGASVLRIARPGPESRNPNPNPNPVLYRNRAGKVDLDLKSSLGREKAIGLIRQADGLLKGFRSEVMERLGLGPDQCREVNRRLVYGRMTGWGRTGPLACTAGHDINYIALTGALHACGSEASGPMPPLNLIVDFGGGGLMLALGMVSPLLHARSSGFGQTVDASMLDGTTSLMAMIYGMLATQRWSDQRGQNFFCWQRLVLHNVSMR